MSRTKWETRKKSWLCQLEPCSEVKGPWGGGYLHLDPFSGPISLPGTPDHLPTTSTCLLSRTTFSSCHNHSASMRSRLCQHDQPQPVPPFGINSGARSTVLSSPMGWNSSHNIKPFWFLFFLVLCVIINFMCQIVKAMNIRPNIILEISVRHQLGKRDVSVDFE